MSTFSIAFDPPLDPAPHAADQEWIDAFDWRAAWSSVLVSPPRSVGNSFALIFGVDDQIFAYYPDTLDGLLGELLSSLSQVRSAPPKTEIGFAVTTYTVLCAERVGAALQFYSPSNSFEGATRKPLDQLELVGEPIDCEAVELVIREAIGAILQLIYPQAHDHAPRA